MALQIYIAGKYYDKENAKISVYDHGLLYGDGIFEGTAELWRQGVSPGAAPQMRSGIRPRRRFGWKFP